MLVLKEVFCKLKVGAQKGRENFSKQWRTLQEDRFVHKYEMRYQKRFDVYHKREGVTLLKLFIVVMMKDEIIYLYLFYFPLLDSYFFFHLWFSLFSFPCLFFIFILFYSFFFNFVLIFNYCICKF